MTGRADLNGVLALGRNVCNGTTSFGWQHDGVVGYEGVFKDLTVNVTACDVVSNLEIMIVRIIIYTAMIYTQIQTYFKVDRLKVPADAPV